MTLLLTLAVLGGCGSLTIEIGCDTPWYPDEDLDGYGAEVGVVTACRAPEGYVAGSGDCDDADDLLNPETEWYTDEDGDGFGVGEVVYVGCRGPSRAALRDGDCFDGNDAIYPGATEPCTGYDFDCDGIPDHGAEVDGEVWYVDADGDGHGDPERGAEYCEQPDDSVAVGDDCDDLDAEVSPSALEVCNGRDDDCDGLSDEAGADGESTWYLDADDDGYGDATHEVTACEPPAGYVADGTDCDDDDSDVLGALTWYPDADGDGYGEGAGEPVCDPGSGFADEDGDCDDTDDTVHPAAGETCDNGRDDDCDGAADGCILEGELSVEEADGEIGATGDDLLGSALLLADLDGDGAAELVIGGPNAGEAGEAYVMDPDVSGPVVAATEATATFTLEDVDGDELGAALAAADLDGDGVVDLVVGAPDLTLGGGSGDEGAAYIFLGPLGTGADADEADVRFDLGDDHRYFGYALAAAEATGDGVADLLVTDAWHDNDGGAWLFAGPLTGTPSTDDSVAQVTGYRATGQAALLEDLDGDGVAEVILSDPDLATGQVGIWSGPATGTLDIATPEVALTGSWSVDGFGWSLAAADLDGDGVTDLLVGAPGADEGHAFAFLGPLSGTVSSNDADLTATGENSDDAFGTALALIGDLDGDSASELVVGAPGWDDTASASGAAYVWYAPEAGSLAAADAGLRLHCDSSICGFGSAIAGVPDLDGDGMDELLIAGPSTTNTSGSTGGAAWLWRGQGF